MGDLSESEHYNTENVKSCGQIWFRIMSDRGHWNHRFRPCKICHQTPTEYNKLNLQQACGKNIIFSEFI